MSYDVEAGRESLNYTSNLWRFFVAFAVYPPNWNGKPRGEVAAAIERALAAIRAEDLAALKAQFDPPNGWGSVEGAIEWLEQVHAACVYQLPEQVRVWS